MKALNLDPDRYCAAARSALLSAGLEIDDGPLSRAELETRIGDYDVIILRFAHQLDADLLAKASRLKVIGTNATGLDHIATDYTEKAGIKVISLRGDTAFLRTIHATAELTWALLLMLERSLPAAIASVAGGEWDRDSFLGRELAGQAIGLLGCGRIGSRVAQYAQVFGMEVHAFDTHPDRSNTAITWHDSAAELCAQVDILSIHLPLNATTRHLVDAGLLAKLRPGARLINTARAGLLDEQALVAALTSGHLGGIALDVLPGENEPGCPHSSALWQLAKSNDRLIITPHIGGAAAQAWEKTETRIAQGVANALRNASETESLANDFDAAFRTGWDDRVNAETSYLHWTRNEPQTQVQLAFRQHWRLFSELLEQFPTAGNRCIELGAGRGTASMYFADAGWDCTLVDISDTVLESAQHTFERHGLRATTLVGDAMRTGLPDGTFDVCVSIGLLEHLPDLKGALTEQVRLLDKHGLLLAYVVPEKDCEVQQGWDWLNDILKAYHSTSSTLPSATGTKPEVYRDTANIAYYKEILASLPVTHVNASGVYPLPMLSPSISFPFTLNPAPVERRLVEHFNGILADREQALGHNPWLCDETYGQSFLVWAQKT